MSLPLTRRSPRPGQPSQGGSTTSPDGAAPGEGGARRRRRARILALAAVLLAAGVVVAIVALGSGSHTPGTAATGVPSGDTTAAVERRTLTESSTVDGTLSHGGTVELYDRLPGTFTWLPAVGAVIGRGGTLFKLDNLPVALMYGPVPAYRALKEGVSDGPDVTELNHNLIDLGFDPYGAISDDAHFGEATALAVRRWQKAGGLPQTGEVQLGRVVFAPGARRITAVHVGVGDDPPEEPASKPPSGSKKPAAKKPAAKKPAAKKPAAREPSGKGKAAKEGEKEKAAKERGEREQAAKEHAAKEHAAKDGSKEPSEKEKGAKEPGGSGGAAPVLVLSTTSGQQIVQLKVKADQQELAHVGESAPVTLPNGDVVRGHITEVGTVATEESENNGKGGNENPSGSPSSGNGENATISVTLSLDHPVAHLDKAPVSVQLVKSIRRNVLAIPATALVATAGGGYAVQALEGSRRVQLAVTPGMFANGYVQVEGAGIRAGLTVIEPR
jgi:peptidoglycan hydrolase-like protein with peptidoglycan-binding domain